MGIRALVLASLPLAAMSLTVARAADAPVAMPRPQPFVLRADAAATNATCESCHTEIAAEWRASFHGRADSDPVYRRALAREPLPFCRGCHAPEADARADASPALSAIGVGCVTCHQTEGAGGTSASVLAAPASTSVSLRASAPHAILRDARFATAAACANCHEFAFPQVAAAQGSRPSPDLMQSTMTEHAASSEAATACATCHMPSVASAGADSRSKHRSHAFLGGHDEALVRGSLTAAATRISASHLRIVLTPKDVGHAVPTGDLFRRLVVSAEVVGDDWTVITEKERALSRKFAIQEIAPGKTSRVLVGDDRVDGARTVGVDLDLGDPAVARSRTIAWRVEYQIVEHPIGAGVDSERPADAVVASRIVIAEGTLGPSAHVRPPKESP